MQYGCASWKTKDHITNEALAAQLSREEAERENMDPLAIQRKVHEEKAVEIIKVKDIYDAQIKFKKQQPKDVTYTTISELRNLD